MEPYCQCSGEKVGVGDTFLAVPFSATGCVKLASGFLVNKIQSKSMSFFDTSASIGDFQVFCFVITTKINKSEYVSFQTY